MVGQILPNNNEKCYNNFSPHFSQLNTALDSAAAVPCVHDCRRSGPLMVVLSNQPNKALKINNGSHCRFYCSAASYLHAIRTLFSFSFCTAHAPWSSAADTEMQILEWLFPDFHRNRVLKLDLVGTVELNIGWFRFWLWTEGLIWIWRRTVARGHQSSLFSRSSVSVIARHCGRAPWEPHGTCKAA
jgi:hypothetical protein